MTHLMDAPHYIMRAGFNVASHGEIATNYTHAQLSYGFHFREIAAGAVDGNDLLQAEFQRQRGDIFQRLTVGQGTFFLDNHGGAYSPGSRETFLPGKAVTLKAKRADVQLNETTPRVEPLFSGHITGYQVTPKLGRNVVRIDAEDRAAFLRRKINLPMLLNTVTSSLWRLIVEDAGVKSREWDIDPPITADVIPFSLIDNMTAGEAIDRLIKSGGHHVYVDGRGRPTWLDRNFNFLASTAATINEYEGLSYDLPWDRVLNDIRIASTPRVVSTEPRTVAFLESAITVPGSGAAAVFFTSWIDLNDQGQTIETGVPVTSATTPVASLDWQLNTQADGGGTDLTSGAALAMTAFAQSALITVVNSNDQPGFLSKFNVRGFPVRRRVPVVTLSQNSSSISRLGRRDFEVETDMIANVAFAQAYGDLLLSQRREPTPVIEISLRNQWPQLLFLDIAKRIVATENVSGINTAWTIRGVDHSITMDPGPNHTARYVLEVSETRKYLVLDRDPEGKLDSDRVLAP